jgi:hypothetical protein
MTHQNRALLLAKEMPAIRRAAFRLLIMFLSSKKKTISQIRKQLTKIDQESKSEV